MLVGSFIGALVRVILCLMFITSDIDLFIFGISNFVDFYIRSVIYRIGLSREYKRLWFIGIYEFKHENFKQ